MPRRPSSANSGTISFGKTASSYHPLMFGLILSRTKERTLSLTPISSSERWASMFKKSPASGVPKAPASVFRPALVTAIFSPLLSARPSPRIIPQRTSPRRDHQLSGRSGYPTLHWPHGRRLEAPPRRREGSRPLAGPGGTVRDDGAGRPRRRRTEGRAPRSRGRHPPLGTALRRWRGPRRVGILPLRQPQQ